MRYWKLVYRYVSQFNKVSSLQMLLTSATVDTYWATHKSMNSSMCMRAPRFISWAEGRITLTGPRPGDIAINHEGISFTIDLSSAVHHSEKIFIHQADIRRRFSISINLYLVILGKQRSDFDTDPKSENSHDISEKDRGSSDLKILSIRYIELQHTNYISICVRERER